MNQLPHITKNFRFEGEVKSTALYGNGHINQTHLVISEDASGKEHQYILQRINKRVFKDPASLMNNYALVTEHLRKSILARGGDAERETLTLVPTVEDGRFFVDEEGEFWRACLFIRDSRSFEKVENPNQFYQSGLAFGNFQALLRDFPAHLLVETIAKFHNTPDRFRQFSEALAEDVKGRAASVAAEIEFVKAREGFMHLFEDAYAEGKLPLRVTHNDTKLNNILFDKNSDSPVCIIDLDTIMPGYAINDFGDSIRFGATTALEDETDLTKVNFDISLFELYAKGFLLGANGGLTDAEIDYLPEAAIMMTLECGTRFLTDHLQGDVYFRTSRENHNLDRARNQFKLVADMEKALPEMHKIIDNLKKTV